MLTSVGIGLTLYLLPGAALQVPGNQPAVRVAPESEFPVGASRVETWGNEVVLVIRPGHGRFVALEGTSPADGCILDWDETARQIVSPCRYIVYDLDGSVVTGLSTEPLRRYEVSIREGVVYVVDPSVAGRG
jgi:nitrite reductase/ring-hydroxylating ferredoxin subunit